MKRRFNPVSISLRNNKHVALLGVSTMLVFAGGIRPAPRAQANRVSTPFKSAGWGFVDVWMI